MKSSIITISWKHWNVLGYGENEYYYGVEIADTEEYISFHFPIDPQYSPYEACLIWIRKNQHTFHGFYNVFYCRKHKEYIGIWQ